MAEVVKIFMSMIMIQLFFAFAVTAIAYTLPADAVHYTTAFSDLAGDISLNSVGEEVQSSLEKQTNIPVIELGALVFYSGNILLDLLLNFAFAIPEMFSLLLNTFMFLFGYDGYILALIQLLISVAFIIVYFIGLIQLVTGIRSGRLT